MKTDKERIIELQNEVSIILEKYQDLTTRHSELLANQKPPQERQTPPPAIFKNSVGSKSGIVNIDNGAALLFPYSSEFVYNSLLGMGELAAQALRFSDISGCDYTPAAMAGAASIIELLLTAIPEDLHRSHFQNASIHINA